MMPGMNPNQMRSMMKKMGMQQDELEGVIEVIIRCNDKNIIVKDAQVSKVKVMGQETFQIAGGEITEESVDSMPDINDDDINTVMEQTGVEKDIAKKAIVDAKGDIAEAILNLTE